MDTIIPFPTFVGAMSGVSYLRVGARKVLVTLTDGRTLSVRRSAFPEVLPEGNDLAFEVASIIAVGGGA